MSAVVSTRWLRRLAAVCSAAVGAAVLVAPGALAAGGLDGIAVGSGAGSARGKIAAQIDLASEAIRVVSGLAADLKAPASVALGDVTGDGRADLIVGGGKGGPPSVNVFDGATGALELTFLAYGAQFRGGVRVAVGDIDGDG